MMVGDDRALISEQTGSTRRTRGPRGEKNTRAFRRPSFVVYRGAHERIGMRLAMELERLVCGISEYCEIQGAMNRNRHAHQGTRQTRPPLVWRIRLRDQFKEDILLQPMWKIRGRKGCVPSMESKIGCPDFGMNRRCSTSLVSDTLGRCLERKNLLVHNGDLAQQAHATFS
jgi:hypothetical protein